MEKTYRLYDIYEGKELLTKTTSMEEVKAAAKERSEDTDDECCLYLTCNGEHVEDWSY
ncbi:MAG: hypothetical protein GX675_01195 [Erysipelotrichaceae bacterium]|nr:hypothetical protein [Erysipelotrichaceae bacterium]